MLQVLVIALILVQLQSHVWASHNDINFNGFGLQNVHQVKLQRAITLLKSKRCKHIYFDMGTNVGIQIRKLFEPRYYEKAPILPVFRKYFGDPTPEARKQVCAFGFEASRVHTPRLEKIDRAYNAAGFPVVIFTETAVSTFNGNVTFFLDKFSSSKFHGWGASVLHWSEKMSNQSVATAGAIDFALFLKFAHGILQHHTEPKIWQQMRIIGKMDIEGSEFQVVPRMIYEGMLCLFHDLNIEWHPDFIDVDLKSKTSAEESTARNNFPVVLNYWLSQIDRCKNLELSKMDDEMYGAGVDSNPLPAPVSV